LFHALDGKREPTPVDDVPLPAIPRRPILTVGPEVVRTVCAKLEQQERTGRLRSAKTRARFMVLASTGVRASELMRAQPADVDLDRRVWLVRDGKGGFRPGLFLNEEMVIAWVIFFAAEAWGEFDTGSMARRLRRHGWPSHIRPYNLRHGVGIGLSEAGIDLADVQAWMGHRSQAMTRAFYVPVLNSRIQKAAEALEGRFGWRPSGSPAVQADEK